MSKHLMSFENIIQLMENNWPSAFKTLFPLFPKLERISANLADHITKIMVTKGLQGSDFHFLTALRRSAKHPPYELMPTEICEYMLFSWGGVAKVMKRLESDGMIIRVACVEDKRVRMVRLTDAGTKLIEDAAIEWLEIQRGLLVNFTLEEIELLDRLLGKMLNQIEKDGIA